MTLKRLFSKFKNFFKEPDGSKGSINLTGDFNTKQVWFDDLELIPDSRYKYYSPNYDWGCTNNGSKQLAFDFSIMTFGPNLGPALYDQLKESVIQWLPRGDFDVSIDFHKYYPPKVFDRKNDYKQINK